MRETTVGAGQSVGTEYALSPALLKPGAVETCRFELREIFQLLLMRSSGSKAVNLLAPSFPFFLRHFLTLARPSSSPTCMRAAAGAWATPRRVSGGGRADNRRPWCSGPGREVEGLEGLEGLEGFEGL